MGPHDRRDEEAANGITPDGNLEQYHDDPEGDDDDETIGPDAPLRASQRPETEFDGLRHSRPTWQHRIAERIPPGLKRAWASTVTWVKGPQPPRIYSIRPFFPEVQHAPIALLERWAPKQLHRFWLLVFWCLCWLFAFSLVLRQSSFSAQIPGHGSPVRLGCQARYWNEGNGCGLNGDQCRPFANATLAFRCPAECRNEQIFNPHAVGDREVVYKPLVVGGPADHPTGFGDKLVDNAVYRGDSFICGSAVHAGFINDNEGGCGVLTLTGEQPSFAASKRNGMSSFSFDSYFPHSFGFLEGSRAQCKDLRWPALVISIIFSAVLSLFTTSPGVFFWTMFVGLFFHVALASDPPSLTDYYSLLSIAFGRFLPACFCSWITYRYTVKRSLTNLTAQVEKTILWLGPCWLGALNNYTFDRIPIQRLTPHDIKAQPGAVPALIAIVLTIFVIALGQAWSFRVEGRMPRYLVVYGLMVMSLLVMLTIPGLNLRIHHYILGLLLVPGTSFQNRPSLVYQGLLVGLFINGVARWGFASILETPGDLLQGAPQGSLLPAVSVLAVAGVRNITFNLGPLPVFDPKRRTSYDGISVLVNDVERFRGYGDNSDYWPDGPVPGGNFTWTWTRHHVGADVGDDDATDPPASIAKADVPVEGELSSSPSSSSSSSSSSPPPEYFRFAYMTGSGRGDYSKAGKWTSEGEWVEMKPGPS